VIDTAFPRAGVDALVLACAAQTLPGFARNPKRSGAAGPCPSAKKSEPCMAIRVAAGKGLRPLTESGDFAIVSGIDRAANHNNNRPSALGGIVAVKIRVIPQFRKTEAVSRAARSSYGFGGRGENTRGIVCLAPLITLPSEHNHPTKAVSKKPRSFVAALFAAGYGRH